MENNNDTIEILLSREELLLALDLLQTGFIPGLEPDPTLGELTAEQRSLVLMVAERALRARELLQLQPDGELVVHNALLRAVGACAYSQQAVLVYHWPAGAEQPSRYFGHIRDESVVGHSLPETGLHLFALLPSPEALAARVLAACEFSEPLAAESLALAIPPETFTQVREMAEAGNMMTAVELLIDYQAAPDTAQRFADTLAGRPRVSVLQLLSQQAGGAVRSQDVTLLQNERRCWLVTAPPAEESSLQIKTVTSDDLSALLGGWLSGREG